MQFNFNVNMWCCLAENGFSLDELVHELKKCYDENGFGQIISLILELTQENLITKALSGKGSFKCCEQSQFVLNGGYSRSVKTSLGKVIMRWRVLKCKCCGKQLTPLKEFIGLKKHQYKSNELEKLVINAVSSNSYRRAVETTNEVGFVSVSKSAAQRWLVKSDCDELDLSKVKELKNLQVIPDGTGYKGLPEDGKAKKGDLKAVIGVTPKGEVIPLGSWADTSWVDVKDDLKREVIHFGAGSILVSDGERGITNNFVELVEDEQRCHWHVVRDLYHIMHQDGGKVKDARPLQKLLGNLIAIELPKEDFQQVSEAEKSDIEEYMESAQKSLQELIAHLESKGFGQAANYVQNSLSGMFGYIKRWLKTGIVCPRASSLIERVMRELGRRIKRIAYNWSKEGVSKMARIILRKFTQQEDWESYWNKKLKLNGNVKFWITQVQ